MCKLYQIEYTCRHLKTVETSYCEEYKKSKVIHGVTRHPQTAPHKCPPCRNYDRDRWRRGWPPLPLPTARRTPMPSFRKVPSEPISDEEDYTADLEENTKFGGAGQVEHSEDSGGVGLGMGFGFGAVVMSGGLNGGDTGSSEGFGLGIDGAGGGGGSDNKGKGTASNSNNTTPTRKNRERGLLSKKDVASAVGVEAGTRSEPRSRFGGFGGRKMGSRKGRAVEMGGVTMERNFSNRGSLTLKSPGGTSYRGADMERGGTLGLGLGFSTGWIGAEGDVEDTKKSESEGGVGLGFGLPMGSGFGAMSFDSDEETVKAEDSDAEGSPRKRIRRRNTITKTSSVSLRKNSESANDEVESITARFLDF